MRDPMTARHSAAVARYSREVAKMLGLDEREQDLIHTAALLHDIGKFIFPDSILFADRKLTDEEWATVKMHPEQGARLVRRIEGYGPVADIIYCHHERYDGNGYYKVPLERDPARLAHHRRGRHLRRDDLARLLPPARELRGRAGRAPPRGRQPARPDRRRDVRDDDPRARHRASGTPTTPTSRLELAFDKRVADYARPRLSRAR